MGNAFHQNGLRVPDFGLLPDPILIKISVHYFGSYLKKFHYFNRYFDYSIIGLDFAKNGLKMDS